MTTIDELKDNPNYIIYDNQSFVGIVQHMGNDEMIERAARVSYQKGTRAVSDTRNLIRYLIRNHHASPLEQCSLTFHIKIPIFVARQFHRHRTFSHNEISGRYSLIPSEFYTPDEFKTQSTTNKQGSDEALQGQCAEQLKYSYVDHCEKTNEFYNELASANVSREQARMVLPQSQYTEMYSTVNLRNFLHFMKLRDDNHAQEEIQSMARAMKTLVEPLYPIVFEAYDDYVKHAVNFSRMEIEILRDLVDKSILGEYISKNATLSAREKIELKAKFEV